MSMERLMFRRHALLISFLALAGCKEATPGYCNSSDVLCTQPGTVCYRHMCQPPDQIPGDAGVDLGGLDLAVPVDMIGIPPDLRPMCLTSAECVDKAKPICDSTLKTCRACAG